MLNSEVISADSDAARTILRDFRLTRGASRFVAELMGEGRLGQAEANTPRKLLVRYQSWESWKKNRPNFFWRWGKALRLGYLPVSLLPLTIALAASRDKLSYLPLIWFCLAIAAVALLQIGAQLWNDYEDHLRGIDSPANSGGSGVIRRLWIPAVHMQWAALVCILSGSGLGLDLFALTPPTTAKYLLAIGLFGAFGAASYSGWPWHYKYLGLGEFIVFFLAGPLLSLAGGILLTGEPEYILWYICLGIPMGILACLRLHAGNLQKIPFDTLAKSRTLANLLTFAQAKKLLVWTMILPFIVVSIFVAVRVFPLKLLSVWVTFPLVIAQWKLIRQVRSPMDPLLQDLRSTTAWQHLFFGLTYGASFFL